MARTRNLKTVMAVLALAVALALVTLLATKPADAASRFRVVTWTFGNSTAVQMPNTGTTFATAIPYPLEINARGFNRGRILDLNLKLKNLSHTFPDDVDVMLSHRGVNRTVMSDVGHLNDVNNITLRLDDEAANPLPDSGPLTGGSFKPTNIGGRDDTFLSPASAPSGAALLSGFDGTNPNGTWSLWVTDDWGHEDSGQFAGGWSITIKARVLR